LFCVTLKKYVAAKGVVVHDGVIVLLEHFFGGDEQELGFMFGSMLGIIGGTLQKGQLKVRPSISLRQHFQQTW
jgi:hypothetical protein